MCSTLKFDLYHRLSPSDRLHALHHLTLWKHLVDTPAMGAMIVLDEGFGGVGIFPSTLGGWEEVFGTVPPNTDIVLLQGTEDTCLLQGRPLLFGNYAHVAYYSILSLSGYLITAGGARRLLACLKGTEQPLEQALRNAMFPYGNIKVYHYRTPLVKRREIN
jgi:hypothetical protein